MNKTILTGIILFSVSLSGCFEPKKNSDSNRHRVRISVDENWKFFRYNSAEEADSLIYDIRPKITEYTDDKDADSKPTKAVATETKARVLKPWILPSGNSFIKNPADHHQRPAGNPGGNFPFVQAGFDDSSWENISLPHDWAIKGPFFEEQNPEVGGGMGRLPSHGVAWYRKKLEIPKSDEGKSIFLQVDGAMSYAMVWLNGNLVGGWPYGYNSWQLDLTPYLKFEEENQLAIRLDNPNHSARWYPGGGIYRNVWLIKTNPVHVAQWGTFVTTENVSAQSATVVFEVDIENYFSEEKEVEISSSIFELNPEGEISGKAVAEFPAEKIKIAGGKSEKVKNTLELKNPRLWGPPPTQQPNLYKIITTVSSGGNIVDHYETRFGIRSLEYDAGKGLIVNGEHIYLKGVNQHHDLGALGAAFNTRAAKRQLETLREMGCNAIRTAHNPPAPELLELTDRLGILVVNEIFDVWELKKTPHDFHLIFPEWHEQDIRAFIRRDRNCPSVIMWSYGNEVGEQYTGEEGAVLAKKLSGIVKDEDPSRLTTASMNFAKPHMEMPKVTDIISLNYQGEGIRNADAYAHLQGIRTSPQYPAFHETFPDKVIVSSETASALSTRGTYLFPVFEEISAPANNGSGGDPVKQHVSAYELYTAPFGASADKVFASQDQHPYVAGEFVWTGWDYLGEPTPYYGARSSYSGIIDLAGFKKDRFYLYLSRWRPKQPMAHILPHWNWPERIGKITPVHVFTSGDEAELFLNENSLGKKKKGPFEYRLRWDDVQYDPGTLRIVAYKNGEVWAENSVKTTGRPAKLQATTDRTNISADGKDLAFITVKVTDEEGLTVPVADNQISVSLAGPGKIIATDNGDPTDMTEFQSTERKAFSGLLLVVIQSKSGAPGTISLTAQSSGLKTAILEINTQ
jgi:beta-galactosidase